MRRLVFDGVGDGFSVFGGGFPFGGMFDDADKFFGEVVIRGRVNGYVTDLAIFTYRELIVNHGISTGHRLREPEMGNDIGLKERNAILEDRGRIEVIDIDAFQKSAVSFSKLDVGESGFDDAGGLRTLEGLALRGGATVLDNPDENPSIGIEQRIPSIAVSVSELTAENGTGMLEVSTVTLFHASHEVPDIPAAVGFELDALAGNDGSIEPADKNAVLIIIELTFPRRQLADVQSPIQPKGIHLRGKG